MSAELDKVVGEVEARRAELAAGVEALERKIPESIGYDGTTGRVFLKRKSSPRPEAEDDEAEVPERTGRAAAAAAVVVSQGIIISGRGRRAG